MKASGGNPLRGEVDFEVGGKRMTLRMGINALCILESELGIGIAEIGEKLRANQSMHTIRSVFRAALGGKLTDEEAGDIIDELGFARASDLIAEAFNRAFAGVDDGPRPPRRAGGTGNGS